MDGLGGGRMDDDPKIAHLCQTSAVIQIEVIPNMDTRPSAAAGLGMGSTAATLHISITFMIHVS